MRISTLGDAALLISQNISELLSAKHHYDQLLEYDERKLEDLAVMKGCAERIKAAADEIYREVDVIEMRYYK